jgi:hypothetical protein
MFLNRYAVSGKYLGKAKVSKNNGYSRQEVIEDLFEGPFAFGQAAEELCEKALMDAKTQLHPLLQQVNLVKLDQRHEFVEAFKHALERVIAERIGLWLPSVKIVYTFDPPRGSSTECWDYRIHLLILVPRLLPSINELGAMLDYEVLGRLKRLYRSRFQDSKSVIEIQQVTPYEIRHGVCYGAMFYSFYTAPSQVWPVR